MSRCHTLTNFSLVERKQKVIHLKLKHRMALMLVKKPRPLSSIRSSGPISVDNDPLSSDASSDSSTSTQNCTPSAQSSTSTQNITSMQSSTQDSTLTPAIQSSTSTQNCTPSDQSSTSTQHSTSTHAVQLTQSNNITTNDDIAIGEIPENSPCERIRVQKRRLAEYETKMDMIKATYLARKEKIKAEYEAEMRRVEAVKETIAAEHAAEVKKIKSEHDATIERINSIKSELGKLQSI